ncbi:MAG: 2'-5' RNA ligase family protein [Burkholderiaceae bacterium]
MNSTAGRRLFRVRNCIHRSGTRSRGSRRVPAHVTVLVPFMAPDQISRDVLAQIQAALNRVPSFAFTLSQVRRFPATAYLAPEPAGSFIALTQALVQSFPAFPPFRGEHESIVPHLTVAHGSASEADLAAAELEAVMRSKGPISSFCSSVSLLENSSGLWTEMHVFTLPRQDG